jgi:hypothetical protein
VDNLPGIIYQDVDLAEGYAHMRYDCRDRNGGAHIQLIGEPFTARGSDLLGRLLRRGEIDVHDGDGCPLSAKSLDDGRSDILPGTSDQNDLSLKTHAILLYGQE